MMLYASRRSLERQIFLAYPRDSQKGIFMRNWLEDQIRFDEKDKDIHRAIKELDNRYLTLKKNP